MTSRALVTVLQAAGRAGVPVCLWGDPGIGKSALIQAAAAADGVTCETVIGSLFPALGRVFACCWRPPSQPRRLSGLQISPLLGSGVTFHRL